MTRHVLVLDQGTTQSKALIFDDQGRIKARAAAPVTLSYPRPGWVETSADSLFESLVEAGRAAIRQSGIEPSALDGVALANQGETAVAWDRTCGDVLGPVISWQCGRTADYCDELDKRGLAKLVKERTGLPINPYFTATKLMWLLDHAPSCQEALKRDRLAMGTTDAYLIARLTDAFGARPTRTDVSTASRTMLLNLAKAEWDDDVLEALRIPKAVLPEVVPNTFEYGTVSPRYFGAPIPLIAACVDQQASLMGHRSLNPGACKVTYGTGAFVLMHCGGAAPVDALDCGLIPTIAWSLGRGVEYALDGGIFTAGAAVEWLVQLGLLESVEQSADVAGATPSSGGVIFVPALAGLAAPYWDPNARGAFYGITRGAGKAEIVRAVLEGVAFRVRDIVTAMGTTAQVTSLRADGGMAANKTFMQIQSDVLGLPIDVASALEATSIGMAYMAGIRLGWWSIDELDRLGGQWERVMPDPSASYTMDLWKSAIARTMGGLGEFPIDSGEAVHV